MEQTLEQLRRQLRQLDELRANGVLDEAAQAQARATIERRIVEQVMSADATTLADVAAAADVGATRATSAPSALFATAAGPVLSAVAADPPPRRLFAVVVAAVVVVAAAGYSWFGTPPWADAGGVSAAAGGTAAPHELGAEQIASMVGKLEERLKSQPDDADGWAMLARSYAVSGNHEKALPAFRKAAELRADDAVLLADYADTLAMSQQRSLAGEPLRLIERALKLEANNLKALSLAGTAAFDRKDYVAALKYWEQLQRVAPPDNVFAKQITGGIDEARKLAGLPPRADVVRTLLPDAAPLAPGAAAASGVAAMLHAAAVSGTVTLAASLKTKAAPEDTLFIYARAAEGSRIPLAIMRRQVKDLPIRFTLDDSQAMSPAAKLSANARVIVAARISKSGSATAQPGDLLGQSSVVALGAKDLQVEIVDTVAR